MAPSRHFSLDSFAHAADAVRGWSSVRVGVVTVATLGIVLGLEHVTGRDVTVAQLFLAPIALATLARGAAVGYVTTLAAVAVGFAGDHVRADGSVSLSVSFWNWTIRGESFAAFAALLASVAGRAAREALLARTDALTGALNRRALEEILTREVARATRTNAAIALAYVDLDAFKAVNDRRPADVRARYSTCFHSAIPP